LLALAAPARAEPQGVALQLEVSINGAPTRLIGAFSRLADGRIGATPAELRELGLKLSPERADAALVLLDDLTGLTYAYAPQTQRIEIRIDDGQRLPKLLDARAGRDKPADARADAGAVLNYALFASGSDHRDSNIVGFDGVSATLDSRVFGAHGTLALSGVARSIPGSGDPLLRLDTTFSRSDPASLVSYRLGDVISGGLPWTRPVRLGGAQMQRNLSLRPDLITMPLPSFSGSAAVPSTVDVFVNNAKAFSGEVPAGPFQINNIPAVSGAGTARIVVRDAGGRETVTTAPFYASAMLLRAGMHDFSFEAGFARRNYGIKSNDYLDAPAASVTWRYGLTDALTLEGHAEGTPGLINVGAGAATRLAAWGRLSGAISFSAGDGRIGGQAYAALEFQLLGLDGRISSQRSLGGYADLASATADLDRHLVGWGNFLERLNSARPPRAVDQFSLAIPLPFDATRIALNVIHLEPVDAPASDIVSLSYTRPLAGDATFLATAFHDFGAHGGSGLFLGITMPLGAGATATAGLTRDKDGLGYGVEAARPLGREPGSVGWQARIGEGEARRDTAAIGYRGDKATLQGRLMQNGDSLSGTGEVTGALVVANSGVFLANRIDDAFAVVDVGAADVDVLHENRRVATTDASGRALVVGLRSYQTARIAIDPTKLPVTADIPRTEVEVTPADRSGVAVGFGVRREAPTALLVLRTADGAYVPAGSRGRVEGREGEFVVGYDGRAYLKDIAGANTVVVGVGDAPCRATFTHAPGDGVQAVIDPVVCR
jgi:outer membrane usher protein